MAAYSWKKVQFKLENYLSRTGKDKISLVVQLYAKSPRQGRHLKDEVSELITLEIISGHLKLSKFRNNPVSMPEQTNFHSKATNETYSSESSYSGVKKKSVLYQNTCIIMQVSEITLPQKHSQKNLTSAKL